MVRKSKTTSVEQFLGDAESPFGVVDMIGNVWEWCSTSLEVPVTRGFYNSVPQNRVEYVVRGGSWKTREENKLTVYYRESKVPLIRDNDLGFRIVCLNRD